MPDRRRTYTVGLVLVFSAALLAAAQPAQAAMSKPTWGIGDYWVYETSGAGAVIPGEGTMRIEVLNTESVTVGTTSYESYKAKLTLNITVSSPYGNLPVRVPGNAWYRVSDLAPVKLTMTMTITIPILNQTITQSMTLMYSPPMEIRWPLTAGASWPVSSTLTAIVNANTTSYVVTGTVSVDQTESQTVPAGTFNTTPVRTTDPSGGYSKAYWSADVGNTVEEKTFESSGTEQGSLELKSYRYTGSAGGTGALDFLGVSMWIWLAIIAVVVVAAVALVFLRRKPPAPVQMPPAQPAQPMPPTGPPMEPGPPQTPPPGSGP